MAKKNRKNDKKPKKNKQKSIKYIASWGEKKFQITSKNIIGIDPFSMGDSYSTDSDSPGREKSTVSFSFTLISGLGYNVRKEIESWQELVGKSDYLKVRNKKLYEKKMQLTGVDVSDVQVTVRGAIVSAKISLSFEEYRKAKKKKTTSTTTSVTSTSGGGGISGNVEDFAWPVPGHTRISSEYGPRICPYHGRETHSGIDIPAPTGTTIVAAQGGTVELAAYNGSYGNCVIVGHGSGLYTLYGHNSRLLVKKGQSVSKKQAIAKAGSTGNSTGPHCHFEVRKGANSYSNHTNPHKYLGR